MTYLLNCNWVPTRWQ